MNKKIEFIGWLSETRDPVVFCKDGGSRVVIELAENEAVSSLALSTMRKHKIRFTAECLPNEHEEKNNEKRETRQKLRSLP